MRATATLLLSMCLWCACESDPEPPKQTSDAEAPPEPGGGYYAHESIPVDAGLKAAE